MPYKIGDIVEAKVISVKPYGAFLSLPNKESGLLHISEMSHGYVSDVNDQIKVDDVIKVKIIDMDDKKKHIVFSRRAITPLKKRVRGRNSFTKKHELIMEGKRGFSLLSKQLSIWIDEYKGDK